MIISEQMTANISDEQIKNKNSLLADRLKTAENLPAKPFFSFVKRCFDVIGAIIGILLFSLPMLIIAVAVKLDSKGTVLYRQERLGRYGKPFMLCKFRSMCMDAEKNGAVWASQNDSRITRVGGFLRNTRLDEIPQLFNILAGQMSFVGPRPERAVFYERFEKYIPGFSCRLKVPQGLTGLAQVNGGYELKPEQKIRYDLIYMKNRSFGLDIICILRTVGVVFSHKGAR